MERKIQRGVRVRRSGCRHYGYVLEPERPVLGTLLGCYRVSAQLQCISLGECRSKEQET